MRRLFTLIHIGCSVSLIYVKPELDLRIFESYIVIHTE